ncbi:D-xylose ABC transporter ATP-binding protein [Candidatus Atribacteria bacterium HGW-Atribacteria-1]|nr:MAG: D-xylose ABC transporter ATP-binding protein [Candidatus Atribacteria bacterium HGW-Atribacteria-1]
MLKDEFIVRIENITKDFPGIRALSNVSFKIKKGGIHGLCGENGAGKSTLVKILAGVYPHNTDEGKIYFNDEELKFTHFSIHQAIKKGIAVVYQELALVPQMTVGENIFLGREPEEKGTISWNRLYSDTKKILKKYKLNIPFFAKLSTLSVGQQQMVEIAKAVSQEVKVLILDEPTSALTEAEIISLMEILKHLKDNGVTCIYISHKLEEFFRITDNITVLRDGRVVNTVKTTDTSVEKVITMMVGREMKERFPIGNRKPGEKILEVKGLSVDDPSAQGKTKIKDVSFDLRKGEILGVAGLMGSGRSELVTAIFGEYGKQITGEILLEGKPVKIRSARDAVNYGISLVPEDRKKMGLVLIQAVYENISLPNIGKFSNALSIDKYRELKECKKYADDLTIKTPSLFTITESLSGGNQQKVVIAKWLMSTPKILILDDPTRGIDVGTKYEIYKLINKLAENGIAIIMISSELEEVLGMSDRIMVMHEGECTRILDRKDATQEKIMAFASGINNYSEV